MLSRFGHVKNTATAQPFSKLIGTTAGYVSYDDNSNTLTERVRHNPYSISRPSRRIEKRLTPQVITHFSSSFGRWSFDRWSR